MRCPKCKGVELVKRKVADRPLELEACPQCRGFWLTSEVIRGMMPGVDKALEVPPEAMLGMRSCPKCQRTMHEFLYPKTLVKVDCCSLCGGLWLDPGEFREISVVRKAAGRKGVCATYRDDPQGDGTWKDRLLAAVDVAMDWVIRW